MVPLIDIFPDQRESPPLASGVPKARRLRIGDCSLYYDKSECLGEGSFSRVYLASTGAGVRLALKEVFFSPASTPEKRQSRPREISHRPAFAREVALLQELRGDRRCMAAVYCDAEGNPKRGYLAQTVFEGTLLSAWSAVAEPRRPSTRRAVIDALGEDLALIHAAGVVHNDIKPDNIFLTGAWSVSGVSLQLGDFGLAFRPHLDAPVNNRNRYTAPEAAIGPVSLAADIYSFGLVCMELVLGVHPFASLDDVFDDEASLATRRACHRLFESLRACRLIAPADQASVPAAAAEDMRIAWLRCHRSVYGPMLRQALALAPQARGTIHSTLALLPEKNLGQEYRGATMRSPEHAALRASLAAGAFRAMHAFQEFP